MSASNHRIKEHQTYHHLMSRIAHRVYFMTDDVKNDFIEMTRRAADFTGIQLVAWCIMTNHFHLLVYLPEPENLTEAEILRRYGVMKGQARLAQLQKKLTALRRVKNDGEKAAQKELQKIVSAMYNVGGFMKIVKQWLTQEYNRRNSHIGTLWESVYADVPVPSNPKFLGDRAGYIHLNPVRAAMEYGFDEYKWSSLNALKRGDPVALAGMRKIYGEEASQDEILAAHRSLMAKLLEKYKFQRAVDIVRKRNAGYEVPNDPLTDEAHLVQAAAHLSNVINDSIEDYAIRRSRGRPPKNSAELILKIKQLRAQNPQMSGLAIAKATGMPSSTIYKYLRELKS